MMAGPGVTRHMLAVCTVLLVYGLVSAQITITKSKPKCCNTKLMDSAGYVMIEGNLRLPPNRTIKATLSTICSIGVDTFAAQIWRRVPGTDGKNAKYKLHWMQKYTTAPNADGKEEKQVVALNEPFVIGEDDYLAFWAKEASRLPVPFEFDASNDTYSFYLSDVRFDDISVFEDSSLELSHKDFVRWPRSFKQFYKFCEELNCADQDVSVISIAGPPGPPGVRGPPGPPGINIISQDDINGGNLDVTCDVPKVEDKVDDAKNKIQLLSNQVSQMQQALNAIYNSNSVTGICPTGMLAGTYGVGSCYIFRRERVSMAIAELRCREDFDAHLVSIESEIEERFLRNEILKSGNRSIILSGDGPSEADVEYFWTAAMFNKKTNQWIWYHEARRAQPVLQYTNWKTKSAPVPSDDQEVCTTLNVNIRTTTSDWHLTNCNKHRNYICEVGKKCL